MIEYLDRLSAGTRAALQSAWRLSAEEGLPITIDAEHLLHGLMSSPDDLVTDVVSIFTDTMQVQRRMRAALLGQALTSEDGAAENGAPGDGGLSDRARTALACAGEEALVMGSAHIAPIHLLVGLVRVMGREAVNATVKQLREYASASRFLPPAP